MISERIGYDTYNISLGMETLYIPEKIDNKTVKAVHWEVLIGPEGLRFSLGCCVAKIIDVQKIVFNENIEEILGCSSGSCLPTSSAISFIGVETINLPKNIKKIDYAFDGYTSLKNINLPEGLLTMDYAFANCTSLQTVTIPNSVTSLHGTFYNCKSLTNIDIPENVTNMGIATFYNCTSMKSINIPNTVTFIDKMHGFKECFEEDGLIGYTRLSIPLFSGGTVNFPNGKNSSVEVPSDNWGADKVTVGGQDYEGPYVEPQEFEW